LIACLRSVIILRSRRHVAFCTQDATVSGLRAPFARNSFVASVYLARPPSSTRVHPVGSAKPVQYRTSSQPMGLPAVLTSFIGFLFQFEHVHKWGAVPSRSRPASRSIYLRQLTFVPRFVSRRSVGQVSTNRLSGSVRLFI
jgi:hypothetical protein